MVYALIQDKLVGTDTTFAALVHRENYSLVLCLSRKNTFFFVLISQKKRIWKFQLQEPITQLQKDAWFFTCWLDQSEVISISLWRHQNEKCPALISAVFSKVWKTRSWVNDIMERSWKCCEDKQNLESS